MPKKEVEATKKKVEVAKKAKVPTRAVLIEAAKDFNESLNLDPMIKIGKTATLGQLNNDISEVVNELEAGDTLNQSTVSTLKEMGFDILVKIKIRGQRSKSVEGHYGYLASLIEPGKYTRKQIMDKVMHKFPDSKKNTFSVMITDGKNPKYNRFAKLIEQSEDNILSFKK